jgi:hypothetical protein
MFEESFCDLSDRTIFAAERKSFRSSFQCLLISHPARNREGFLESDRIKTLDLPHNGSSPGFAKRLESAMKADSRDLSSTKRSSQL